MATIRTYEKKNGAVSFILQWRDPDTGKQPTMTFESRLQAENVKRLLEANGNRLAAVEAALSAAKKVESSGSLTLTEAFEKNLALNTRANEHTLGDYRRLWKDRVSADLGSLPIAAIDEETLAAWIRESLKKYSRKTMANTVPHVTGTFALAARRGWIEGNPAEGLVLPADQATERKATFLTLEEFWLVHDEHPERYRLMVETFAASGLRFAEMTALGVELTRDALQRSVPVLPVVRAWKEKKGGGFTLGAPKANSVRDVSIPAELAGRILESMKDRSPDDLVFVNYAGKMIGNANFHTTGWKGAIAAARKKGLTKKPRPHDLRHTHASWMLAEGMSAFDVSRRLGHKSIETTTRLYGHLMPKALIEGAAAVSKAMARPTAV